MPGDISYPGVYIEEISSVPRAITGVPTSVAAFAGWAPKGPTHRAEPVSSWADFEDKFGGLDTRSFLGYSVSHFFNNGGSKACIVRLGTVRKVLKPNDHAFEQALLPTDGKRGLYALDRIDTFNLLCVPGETNAATIVKLQEFCRARRAFLIVDCPESAQIGDLKAGAGAIQQSDSINSAFYFPWLPARDVLQNREREFPPCGFVAGVYARTDSSRGLWKAPAGIEASLKGVSSLAPGKRLTETDNGVLNRKGINCIRQFADRGTVVWGSRTLRGADEYASEWKYIPVRRTALFIEQSLVRGLEWVVFEQNDEPLWAKIRQSVWDFMYTVFRQGAFQGMKPEDAYFVKCDRTTTTQVDIDQGFVNIVVGFAPLKPAEFVIIRIRQMAGQTDV